MTTDGGEASMTSPDPRAVPDLAAARETALKSYLAAIKLGKIGNDAILAACRGYAAALGSVPAVPLGEPHHDLQCCPNCSAILSGTAPRGEEVEPQRDLPYDAVSVNGRANEWRVPLWDAINALVGLVGIPASKRISVVIRVEEAVEKAMRLAVECSRGEEVERIVRETLDAIEDEPEGWSATAEEVARVIARVHARLGRKGEG